VCFTAPAQVRIAILNYSTWTGWCKARKKVKKTGLRSLALARSAGILTIYLHPHLLGSSAARLHEVKDD
jgi:hypothetical protein